MMAARRDNGGTARLSNEQHPSAFLDSSGTTSQSQQEDLRVSQAKIDNNEEMPRNYRLKRSHTRSDSFSSDEFELLEKLPPVDEKGLETTTALPQIPKGYNEKLNTYMAQRASATNSNGRVSLDGDAAVDAAAVEPEYPGMKQRMLIVLAILLAAFLTALDRTIIATAIPAITDEFNSLEDIGWYGSSFMLTASCFQLILGRIYSFYPPKYVFLICLTVFEVGSAVCGAAPNSVSLIIGRAIAGLGTAGIMSGAIIMMVATIPLEKRPIYQGLFGAVFGASSVAGPLIGGAFTTDVSWRWCFYLNLPVGCAAIAVLIFVLPATEPTEPGLTIREQLGRLDLVGEFFLFPCIICLLLALQWGGSTYKYGDWRIILLYTVFGLCLVGFVATQIFMQKSATVPGPVIANRSMIAATFFTITISGAMIMVVYFLPLWFQAIKDTTALKSGIYTIPTVIASVLGSVIAGGLVSKVGYYTPFMILGSVGGAVGCGLISTFTIHTGSSKWIGYQVVLGFCLGAGMQQGSLVAQTVLEKKYVNMGISLLFLTQQIGSAIFLSVGENVFSSSLIHNIKKALPGVNPSQISNSGATDLRKLITGELLETILVAYNNAIRQVFFAGIILAGISTIGAVLVEFKSVKKAKEQDAAAAAIDKTQIGAPISEEEMPVEIVTKPRPMRKSYLNKPLPTPPSRPASSRRPSRPVSQRLSQALTAVISEYEVPELPKLPHQPPIARVRHVAELRRSTYASEHGIPNRRIHIKDIPEDVRKL